MQTDKLLKAISKKSLNLLLADRDEITLFRHRRIAEESGYFRSIRSAKSGLLAFDHLNLAASAQAPFPDILMLDVALPVMNAITLLKVLQKWDFEYKHLITPIVVTSSISASQKETLQSLGVSIFLSKPLTAEALQQAIGEKVERLSPLKSRHPENSYSCAALKVK
jgi:CheY-like chemotaxis protein